MMSLRYNIFVRPQGKKLDENMFRLASFIITNHRKYVDKKLSLRIFKLRNYPKYFKLRLKLRKLPRIRIDFWHELYFNMFNSLETGPSPQKCLPGFHKSPAYLGAGMLIVPSSIQELRRGTSKRNLRNNVNRVINDGYTLRECTHQVKNYSLRSIFHDANPNLACHFSWRDGDPRFKAFELVNQNGAIVALNLARQEGDDWYFLFSLSTEKEEIRWLNQFLFVEELIQRKASRLFASSMLFVDEGLQRFAKDFGYSPINLICNNRYSWKNIYLSLRNL